MNKKGFTLVELLAVIAILAILVIIALPNVMGMFNQAKKNSFITELKQIYKVAEQQWMTDSMTETSEQTYSRCKTCTGKSLNLSGRTELDYYIVVDKSGKVVKFYATDGTYQFKYDGRLLSTEIENVEEVAKLSEDKVLNISDGGETVVPRSFATDSWSTIIAAVRSNNTSVYNLGDTRTIDMGSLGTHTVRIANKTTPSECSTTGFSQTACGFVIEFENIISVGVMNPSATNVGGWPASQMRSYVNSTVYNALPSDLKSIIIDTTVISSHGNTTGESNFTSTDKLYLFSSTEVGGYESNTETDRNLTRKLDFYVMSDANAIPSRSKLFNGANNNWWLRSSQYNTNSVFAAIGLWGSVQSYTANREYGVSPAFRIG